MAALSREGSGSGSGIRHWRSLCIAIAILLAPITARAQVDSTASSGTSTPVVTPVDEGEDAARRAESVQPPPPDPRWARVRARYDLLFGWAPRYRLDVATDPLGLEQQLWRRVDMLPLYHRVSAQGSFRIDESTSISLSFAGWGSLNLLEDSGGGLAAGDVAIGFAELEARPVSLWVGRRFLMHGPPGGLHVDGGGVAVRSDIGLFAEAFVGRPVTPRSSSLVGPQMDFEESAVAYGARAGYAESGVLAASAGYAEIWRRGVLGSRTVDVAATWDPGPLRLEGAVKLDAAQLGVVQARLGVAAQLVRELSVDADYLHLEPGRWIPTWSILSVFETSTFDEASVGATVRPVRMLAIRAELAGRLYSNEIPGDARVGYRAELTLRLAPDDSGTAARVLVSRRDDGVIGYTVLSAGTAFDLLDMLSLAIDGAFAIDDAAQRLSAIGRGSLELSPDEEWAVGGTLALAHTAFSEAELRAMLRLRWSPEVR